MTGPPCAGSVRKPDTAFRGQGAFTILRMLHHRAGLLPLKLRIGPHGAVDATLHAGPLGQLQRFVRRHGRCGPSHWMKDLSTTQAPPAAATAMTVVV